jgi:hypothetical protein
MVDFLFVFYIYNNMKVIITESQLKGIIKEVSNKKEDRVKIYQDENIVVVAPLTHRSSCKYGAYTKWCTAVPSTDEHFNYYMQHGVLIYFIIRSPYKTPQRGDYKFAYYQPFSKDAEELKGWYDMSDNQLELTGDESKVDKNLIKFLIPDEIFKLVTEYINEQKPLWSKRLKETKKKIADYFVSDIHNTMNTIVNDSNWFISFRKDPFDNYEFYRSNNFPYVYFSPANAITIFYVNKRTKQIYKQKLDYYKDLRNYEFKGTKFLDPIEDVYTDNPNEKMFEVFDRYYLQILRAYFNLRKKDYNPNENSYLYMPPQYVQKGDFIGGGVRNTEKIHDITTDPRNGRLVISTIDSKGEIRNNSYYSDEYGIGMKYDKEKHNPM